VTGVREVDVVERRPPSPSSLPEVEGFLEQHACEPRLNIHEPVNTMPAGEKVLKALASVVEDDVEYEIGVWWYCSACALCSVALFGRNVDSALSADFHS